MVGQQVLDLLIGVVRPNLGVMENYATVMRQCRDSSIREPSRTVAPESKKSWTVCTEPPCTGLLKGACGAIQDKHYGTF